MKLLIDADIVLYKGLWACKDQNYYAQLRACDNIVEGVIDTLQPSSYELVVSGKNNFRKKIYPEYKANRKAESRPPYLYDATKYVKKYWNAVEAKGEADDYIGIHHNKGTIIVSIDKDLKQLGGKYFNLNKWEIEEVEDEMLYFWIQMITGDASDNVPGVKNPYKSHHKNPPNFSYDVAYDFLKDKTPEERITFVESAYEFQYGNDWHEKFDLNGRLLWILRDEDKTYEDYI